nr:hypothetical protein BaRGS_006830 [Batillaria attramentaria]
MGFKMPHIAVIIGLVCIGVALIFQIVGPIAHLLWVGADLGEYEGNGDFGYSFALTIVAFLLCIAAGVCFLVPKFVG